MRQIKTTGIVHTCGLIALHSSYLLQTGGWNIVETAKTTEFFITLIIILPPSFKFVLIRCSLYTTLIGVSMESTLQFCNKPFYNIPPGGYCKFYFLSCFDFPLSLGFSASFFFSGSFISKKVSMSFSARFFLCSA